MSGHLCGWLGCARREGVCPYIRSGHRVARHSVCEARYKAGLGVLRSLGAVLRAGALCCARNTVMFLGRKGQAVRSFGLRDLSGPAPHGV